MELDLGIVTGMNLGLSSSYELLRSEPLPPEGPLQACGRGLVSQRRRDPPTWSPGVLDAGIDKGSQEQICRVPRTCPHHVPSKERGETSRRTRSWVFQLR
jgi:hypothetical protein